MKFPYVLMALLVAVSVAATAGHAQDYGKPDDSFEISQKIIIVNTNAGEQNLKEIRVANKLPRQLSLKLSAENMEGVSFADTLTLGPHAEQPVQLAIKPNETGFFIGSISFIGEGSRKSVPIILEVESPKPKYAAKVDIPAEFRDIEAGKDLTIRLSVLGVREKNTDNIDINYEVRDFNNTIILREKEASSVNGTLTLLRKFPLPPNLPGGDYAVAVRLQSGDSVSVSSRIFSVVSGNGIESLFSNNILYVLITLVIAVVIILYLNYSRLVSMEKKREKVVVKSKVADKKFIASVHKKLDESERRFEEKGKNINKLMMERQKMEGQLASLTKAYKAGYISKKAYSADRKRLRQTLQGMAKRLK